MYTKETIYAPATVAGTGAISIIRVSGSEAFKVADAVITLNHGTISEAPGYSIRFGRAHTRDGKVLDEVLVSVFRAPHSYTGEDSVEISCHASTYIVTELMAMLLENGARLAEPGEFTMRAFLNGKMDLAQAEAVADVIASNNAAAHRVAFNQMKGGFSKELRQMREELLKMVSLMELELDFSEEEVEFADRRQLLDLVDEVKAHVERLAGSFRLGNAIKNGIPVAIVGATNVGKSTLLNALLGEERAIVSDIHGTTRDTIEETFNIGGTMFRLIDTAGLRQTSDEIEKIGIERSYSKMHGAMIVLAVFDATAPSEKIESELKNIISKTDLSSQKLFMIGNKADILTNGGKEGNYEANSGESGEKTPYNIFVSELNKNVSSTENNNISTYLISAKTGQGIEALKDALAATRQDLQAAEDATLVTNQRHYEALTGAAASLERVHEGLTATLPTDLVAQDIREALYTLGTITGTITPDEILGNIFRNFCIGK